MILRDPYTAIADPTRREILDLLEQNSLVAAGEIAAHFNGLSRPAISRHLRILRECGVITALRSGKQQNYSLIRKPINDIREGWLAKFGDAQSNSLASLRMLAENKQPNSE